ncbi:hypothetical protein M011DRAFT_457661 [Sporormia fimetaria CBS 119925]|uniref:Ras-GAP domain-containing protein n=1 Tax=Sporormia fimetaria CBS 119925 TaxID=1340428 RepID=A0A6A6VCG3_9PLEO|nr:hypothetical protein M011DRAFT_457661 [Sporormia fimetaria CBS 119925]
MEQSWQRRDISSNTIRAVTPDSIPEGAIAAHHYTTSPPISPRSGGAHASRSGNPRSFVARTNSTEGDYLRNARDTGTRPRTRTLEERSTRDRSPPNVFGANRHRIGSVHSAASANFQGIEEAVVTSIGHPSVTSAQPPPRTSSNSRSRLMKQPPRTSSPLSQTESTPQTEAGTTSVPSADFRRVVQLMKSTCGKMQGQLAFRRDESNPWSASYCYINEEAGSLVYEPKTDTSYHKTLIPDLRGCRVQKAYDAETYTDYIHITPHNSNLEVSLRPYSQDDFESWHAALLCWSPIRPKGIGNKMAKPQGSLVPERRLTDSRRHSEVSLLKEAPIIKVGKMIYWDTGVTYSSNTGTPKSAAGSRPHAYRIQSHGSRRWRRVSCTLRENGELKLYSDTDVTLVSVVQLSQLSRCAVQRLDPSVLDNDFCIAIYPQYSTTATSVSLLRPIFLSLDSRVLYEVWIVLLRAFTIPQLYGPKPSAMSEDGSVSSSFGTPDMFRMERSLFVRVIEARILPPVSPKLDKSTPQRPSSSLANHGGYYVEVLLDGETRARTMAKSEGHSPFWREEFEFADVPAVLSTASLLLKKRIPTPHPHHHGKDAQEAMQDSFMSEASGGYAGISFDQTIGKADIFLDDLDTNQEVEKWWPLVNMYGNAVGEVLVKVSVEECVILMARDYQPMSELLHRFDNGLTLQIAQMIPNELRKLSEYLLNIFQVSGKAIFWMNSLVEEEIDGTLKETPVSRLRFSKRLGSTDSGESGKTFPNTSERELFLRDMGNNAKLEANLLFRGNTLLTKALDLHMKRLGKEYLEDVLAEKLREIDERDYECEVDPNRIESRHELERNWRRLINLTEEIWRSIYNSVSRCPQELRLIFRHIQACAEDRYGGFLRTVKYSSVSGFLFLRFFVPAVLNPKLFGLLKDHPKPRARRTLTLIAKSLQGLANMSSFGTKESWMEPMNAFLTTHRQEFKTYLDNICSISSSTSTQPSIPPSYSTPLAILQRLPPTSREGFPSLPYLVDHARNFAALVKLWLDNTESSAPNIQTGDGDLLHFHNICVSLRERTNDCLNRAERAERPNSSLEVKWEELIDQFQGSATFDQSRGAATRNKAQHASNLSDVTGSAPVSPGESTTNGLNITDADSESEGTSTPITMKPLRPTKSRHGQTPSISASQSSVTSASSHALPNPFSRKEGRAKAYRANESASASASAAEDETPPGSADAMDFPPVPSHPPFAYPYPSHSSSSFSHPHNAGVPNLSHIATQTQRIASTPASSTPRSARSHDTSRALRNPNSAGAQSMPSSDSLSTDEYTTALPVFDRTESSDKKKEKSERGLQKILPFIPRRGKREDRERDRERERERERDGRVKERERERDRDRSMERDRSGSALGIYGRENGARDADF